MRILNSDSNFLTLLPTFYYCCILVLSWLSSCNSLSAFFDLSFNTNNACFSFLYLFLCSLNVVVIALSYGRIMLSTKLVLSLISFSNFLISMLISFSYDSLLSKSASFSLLEIYNFLWSICLSNWSPTWDDISNISYSIFSMSMDIPLYSILHCN